MEFEKKSVFSPQIIDFCQITDVVFEIFLLSFLQFFPFLNSTIIVINTWIKFEVVSI